MSLTHFLKDKEVKEKFSNQFSKPRFSLKKEILAPPRSNRYSLVGTAFDYLLRFLLEHYNSDVVITRRWVAEVAVNIITESAIQNAGLGVMLFPDKPGLVGAINRKTGEPVPIPDTVEIQTAKRILAQTHSVHKAYLDSSEISKELLECVLRLAQLDVVYRTGYVDPNLGVADEEDVADLQRLFEIVDPEMFHAREHCFLNPTFGEASHLVGGADADLVIDSTLIDIKTTKNPALKPDDFNQLMGYYVLNLISGIEQSAEIVEIDKVGIYFSRHAELYTIPVKSVIDEDMDSFIAWFKEKAAETYRRFSL